MTIKQKQFVKNFIKHKGNGTLAAIESYDVKNKNTAHVIASENLRKPTIKREIELAMEAEGLTDEYISELLREAVTSGIGKKATNADSLRGIDMMLKLKSAYPPKVQKSAHFKLNLQQEIKDLSYTEILNKLKVTQKETQDLLSDIGDYNEKK